jgi:hypothetical protein
VLWVPHGDPTAIGDIETELKLLGVQEADLKAAEIPSYLATSATVHKSPLALYIPLPEV